MPKITVGTTKVNSILNSLLFKSARLAVNIFEYAPPKLIFWYNTHIVYCLLIDVTIKT